MKLVSFRYKKDQGIGVVRDNRIVDLSGHGVGRSMKHLLRDDALDRVAKLAASLDPGPEIEAVELLPAVTSPGKILCIGINYKKHVLEMQREMPEHPWVFVRFADSLVGHNAAMIRPAVSDKFDFEGELAVVIGRAGHRVRASAAMDHVAGYCCFNDGSIRDFQRHSSQFTAGKNFLRSGSMGPWIATKDEVPDVCDLQLETRLNGEVMQSSSTGDLIFNIPTLIEYCSTFTRLEPGDVIATGTPGGVGAARTPPVWLRPGDVVEVSISTIGRLRNTVADE